MKILIAVVGLVATALCSSPMLFADEDTHSARVGDLRVTVTAVDTGPITAPVARPQPPRGPEQLVLVRARIEEMKLETSCTSFTGQLKVDTAEQYEPQETLIGGWRGTVQPVVGAQRDGYFAFILKQGAKPAALILERDTKADEACRARSVSYPRLPLVVPQVVMVPLDGLPTTHDIALIQQGDHLIRFGELQISATAVAIAPALGGRVGMVRPHAGHHFVIVGLRLKNASRYPSCIRFYATLTVDRGYQYRDEPKGEGRPPETYDLLPGWERRGSYAFEVHDGTTPVALMLRRYPQLEKICAGPQHRPVDTSGGAAVRITLSGAATLAKRDSE